MDAIQGNSAPARLSLWDAVSIILGIIIGVGIFEIPSKVFEKAPTPQWALAVWLIGGLLALAGALCFAELASTYPRSGGEYVYLTRSFGSLVGYMFAWAQLAVIRPGSIGAMAYIFADYAAELWDFDAVSAVWISVIAVLSLTLINILGVNLGTTTQNLLTVAKVIGLLGIIVAGLIAAPGIPDVVSDALAPAAQADPQQGWFAVAMIFVLWTYAGWHEAAYIASEVKDRQRNLPRALILGAAGVTVIYLLFNFAVWQALGFEGARAKVGISEVIGGIFPGFGPEAFRILVMVSALGAVNGIIFTTARIYSEFGADHRLFQPLSHWSRRMGTPVRALMTQGMIAVALILLIAFLGKKRDGFDEMVEVTAAVFWMFFFLTGLSLFVLRRKDPDLHRPFRVPLYPWLPIVFCSWCVYMMYGAVRYSPWLSLMSLALLAAGLPFYYWPKKKRRRPEIAPSPEPVVHA